jgi:hypothetical protein
MYHQSKRVLIFLVFIFSTVTIACAVIIGILDKNTSGGKLQPCEDSRAQSSSSGFQRRPFSLEITNAVFTLREIPNF